jgi:hypothetical protein
MADAWSPGSHGKLIDAATLDAIFKTESTTPADQLSNASTPLAATVDDAREAVNGSISESHSFAAADTAAGSASAASADLTATADTAAPPTSGSWVGVGTHMADAWSPGSDGKLIDAATLDAIIKTESTSLTHQLSNASTQLAPTVNHTTEAVTGSIPVTNTDSTDTEIAGHHLDTSTDIGSIASVTNSGIASDDTLARNSNDSHIIVHSDMTSAANNIRFFSSGDDSDIGTLSYDTDPSGSSIAGLAWVRGDAFVFEPSLGNESVKTLNSANDLLDIAHNLHASFAELHAELNPAGEHAVFELLSAATTTSHVIPQNPHLHDFHLA